KHQKMSHSRALPSMVYLLTTRLWLYSGRDGERYWPPGITTYRFSRLSRGFSSLGLSRSPKVQGPRRAGRCVPVTSGAKMMSVPSWYTRNGLIAGRAGPVVRANAAAARPNFDNPRMAGLHTGGNLSIAAGLGKRTLVLVG